MTSKPFLIWDVVRAHLEVVEDVPGDKCEVVSKQRGCHQPRQQCINQGQERNGLNIHLLFNLGLRV